MKMWSDLQGATVGSKRRAPGVGVAACEGGAGGGKAARWEDSIARLEAVAAGAGEWRRRGWCAGWCGAHDTIRAENGKCYLELGGARACCDGRAAARCASRRCYRERRLKMMNLCAFKLARFRQTADPSLRRSVLVCNTLRGIEREVEREAAEEAPEPAPPAAPPPRERAIDWGSVLRPAWAGEDEWPWGEREPDDTFVRLLVGTS